jgi:hypothetical protein
MKRKLLVRISYSQLHMWIYIYVYVYVYIKSRNLMFIYQYLAFFCHKPSTQPSKLRVKFIIKAINALICLGYDIALNLS